MYYPWTAYHCIFACVYNTDKEKLNVHVLFWCSHYIALIVSSLYPPLLTYETQEDYTLLVLGRLTHAHG